MRIRTKVWAPALVFVALATATAVLATVNVVAGPTSLVTSPLLVKASSAPVALFSVTLGQDAGETLSSINVVVNAVGTSTVASVDLASLAVYKDNGDGIFNSGSDLLAGSNTLVNVGTTTVATTTVNNTLNGGKFFVTLSTSASWSDASPADKITVTMPADAIKTSANSPTTAAVTTSPLIADTTAPTLVSAVAQNTGGTTAKEAGDSVKLTFSESTNEPAVTAGNIGSIFTLNNSHSFLDGTGALGATSWNIAGDALQVTLSAASSTPSVAVGDTVTVVTPSAIMDLAGNKAAGSQTITGSFATTTPPTNGDGEDDEDNDETGHACANTLVNGKLYKVADSPTVYLAAACRLKPFKGAAVFHARGQKFQNIIVLSSLPSNVTISQKPVLPTAGTLVKGSDKTVWFVTEDGHRKGFKTADKYLSLGFRWGQVQTISDADLTLIPVDQPISEGDAHPDGTLLKCNVSGTVYQIIGAKKFPFTSASAYLGRGHTWDNLVSVDCTQYNYILGAAVQ